MRDHPHRHRRNTSGVEATNDAHFDPSSSLVGQTWLEPVDAREPVKRIRPMNIQESVEQLPTNGTRGRVYGEPYRTADGGTARWVPAIDSNRIALIGIITGLISATIGTLAVLRRPPWPDLSATSAAWTRPPHVTAGK